MMGVGWVVVEFALQPLGLRGGLLSGAVGDGWLVEHGSELFGYTLVACLVATGNAVLLVAISDTWIATRQAGARRPRTLRPRGPIRVLVQRVRRALSPAHPPPPPRAASDWGVSASGPRSMNPMRTEQCATLGFETEVGLGASCQDPC